MNGRRPGAVAAVDAWGPRRPILGPGPFAASGQSEAEAAEQAAAIVERLAELERRAHALLQDVGFTPDDFELYKRLGAGSDLVHLDDPYCLFPGRRKPLISEVAALVRRVEVEAKSPLTGGRVYCSEEVAA